MTALHAPSVFTLPSGLKVAAVERPQGKTLAMALAYRVGSFDDPPGLPGAAHFAEHLAFRGPNIELAQELAVNGAAVSGYTSHEYTFFGIQGHVDQLNLGLKFMANIVECAPRTAEEIAFERQIFRHELAAAAPQADRDAVLERYWRATQGDPNWKIGRRRQLWRVKRLQPGSMNSFKSVHYRPENAALAIVGPVSADELWVALERLGQMSPSDAAAASSLKRSPRKLSQVTLSVDVFRYAWIYLTHIVESADPITRLTAQIVTDLLGGGPHSELFRRLRMEQRLAYAVYADDLHYLRHTAIYSYASVPSRSVNEALEIMLKVENDVAKRGLTADQLEFAKHRLCRDHELHLDYPEHLAAYLAYEALRPSADALLDPDSYLEKLSSLTLAQANTAVATLFSPTNRYSFIGGRLGPYSRFRIRRKLRAT